MSGRRFFLVWMLTFLGFPVGGELAFLLVGSIDGAADGALGGGVAGAVIGAAQWLVLRGCLGMTPNASMAGSARSKLAGKDNAVLPAICLSNTRCYTYRC